MKYKTDVLVIGAGGAGLRAAIGSADCKADVLLVGKTLLGKAHTVMAAGGINAALGNIDQKDNWNVHFADTIREGQFINDWRMVEILTKEALEIILELESYGAIFDRTTEGKIMQRPFGGHTFIRTCHIGDRTGLEIMQVLMSEVMKRSNIQNLEECIITKLVRSYNRIIGAIGVSLRTGEMIVVECKAIILATGGLARIYKISTNAWETVGDGYFLTLDAGVELADMEMIQFHPTGMVYPPSVEGMLVTESVRGDGGILLNANGERFMKRYDSKRMELSTRDVVARAIFSEITGGRGTKNKGVWLDISHKPKNFIEKKLPKMVSLFKDFADVDITKEKMEVAPTAHYAMGGVVVDPETCHSSLNGLFAAGEVTSGIHGANRLGGNSLLDILVFGKRAGKYAANYIRSKKLQQIPDSIIEQESLRLTKPFTNNGIRPIVIKKKIQELMWAHVGIIREKNSLVKASNELSNIKRELKHARVIGVKKYNHEWVQYIDILAMIPVCEAIVMSALSRTESRGAHYRSDYPERNNKQWLKNIVVKMQNGKIKLSLKPVLKVPEHLQGGLNEDY